MEKKMLKKFIICLSCLLTLMTVSSVLAAPSCRNDVKILQHKIQYPKGVGFNTRNCPSDVPVDRYLVDIKVNTVKQTNSKCSTQCAFGIGYDDKKWVACSWTVGDNRYFDSLSCKFGS